MTGKNPTPIDDQDRARYEWQLDIPDFGEEGQERLKNSSVLISRVGGLGSVVAYELAAAGVGKITLAHAGNLKVSDLNRQLLMTDAWIGKPRVESAKRRLLDLNPHLQIDAVPENVTEDNAADLVSRVDLVVDCAPLFDERFALNEQCVKQKKPMVECAMYELEGQLTTILPGVTPCLSCLFPENPSHWKRRFPVFGAVSGTVGCMAAMEAIKVLTDLGTPLAGTLLTFDLRTMRFDRILVEKSGDCRVCSGIG